MVAKSIKFGTVLAATFFNISAENYTNVWSKSNATGISFMHIDVKQW